MDRYYENRLRNPLDSFYTVDCTIHISNNWGLKKWTLSYLCKIFSFLLLSPRSQLSRSHIHELYCLVLCILISKDNYSLACRTHPWLKKILLITIKCHNFQLRRYDYSFFIIVFSNPNSLCQICCIPKKKGGPGTRSVDTNTVNIHKYGLTCHFPVPKIHTFKTRLDLSCESEFYL